MTNAGKLFQIFLQGFGNRTFFLQAQNLVQTNRADAACFVHKQGSGISRRVTTLPPKSLSQVKTCDKLFGGKIEESQRTGKRRNFPLNIFQ